MFELTIPRQKNITFGAGASYDFLFASFSIFHRNVQRILYPFFSYDVHHASRSHTVGRVIITILFVRSRGGRRKSVKTLYFRTSKKSRLVTGVTLKGVAGIFYEHVQLRIRFSARYTYTFWMKASSYCKGATQGYENPWHTKIGKRLGLRKKKRRSRGGTGKKAKSDCVSARWQAMRGIVNGYRYSPLLRQCSCNDASEFSSAQSQDTG